MPVRHDLVHVEQDTKGNTRPGASVTIFETDGVTPIAQTLYDADDVPQTNPGATDNLGVLELYTALPQKVMVQPAGGAAYPSRFDVDPASLWTVNVRAHKPTAGSGTGNDGQAVQDAIDALGPGGGTVLFPGGPGTVYRIGQTITLPSHVTFFAHGAVIRYSLGFTGTLFRAATPVSNVLFDGLIVDNESSTANRLMFDIAAGSDHVAWRHCRLINTANYRSLTVGTITAPLATTQSVHITFEDSSIERVLGFQGTPPHSFEENFNAIGVIDASYVSIRRNRFLGCGGVQVFALSPTASPASNPMKVIRIQENTFVGVQCTNCGVQSNDALTVVEDVQITDNIYRDGGKWMEKGAISLQNQVPGAMKRVTIARNQISGMGYSGSSGGLADPNSASGGIDITTTGPVSQLRIENNTIDGAQLGATTAAGLNVGLMMRSGPFTDVVIANNLIANMGWCGIALRGAAGGRMTRLRIDQNTVVHCCTSVPNDIVTAAISLMQYVARSKITNNLCANNGAAGNTLHAGIGIGDWWLSGDPSLNTTLTDIDIEGNTCYDDQGTPTQTYGVRVGASGQPDPASIRLRHNTLKDNRLDGAYVSPARASNHEVARNNGYGTAGEILVTTAGASATFTIPIGTLEVPFAGLLLADTQFGDTYAVNLYLVIRNLSSSAFQILSAAPISTAALAGGTAPTVASTTPSSGTFTVTRTGGSGTTTVRLIPLRRGAA